MTIAQQSLPLTPERLAAVIQPGEHPTWIANIYHPSRASDAMMVDGRETIYLAIDRLNEGEQETPDLWRYFTGQTPDFPPFALISEGPENNPERRTPYEAECLRLFQLGLKTRSFDWVNDVRHEAWTSLGDELGSGAADDPVDGCLQFLWDYLYGVARQARFVEGALRADDVAQVRIANEIRRRLMGT